MQKFCKVIHSRRLAGRLLAALLPVSWAHAATSEITGKVSRLMEASGINHSVGQIQELNRVTGGAEMVNNITEAIVLATALGINAAQPRQQQVPADTIRKQVKADLPQIHKQNEQLVTSMMLYTYRSLADKEIENYIQFANSASGTAYHKSAVAGVGEALLEAIARFMTVIPKAMERTRGAVGA